MAEQEKIQKYIIKSTPYGELTQVFKDLDKISPVDLNSPVLSQALEEYNEEHLAIIKTEHVVFALSRDNSQLCPIINLKIENILINLTRKYMQLTISNWRQFNHKIQKFS